MTKETTKRKILDNGAKLVHAKGFVNTGIQEILNESGVPKGSFYFYFKSKEDFGQALVDHYSEYISSLFDKYLRDKNLTPRNRLNSLFTASCKYYESTNFTCGCPIGNMSQEVSDLSEAMRKKLNDAYTKMRSAIKDSLAEAQEQGQLEKKWNTSELAAFILNGWEGALIDMKVSKSITPLMIFKKMIFEFFIK